MPAEGADPIDLRAMVRGPDGAPYVIDRSTRVGLPGRPQGQARRRVVVRVGPEGSGGTTVATPRFLGARRPGPAHPRRQERRCGAGGRPTTTGKGTLDPGQGQRARASWGDDIRGIGTFLRDASAGLYNLYVVDPSEQQILAYSPAADGSGFPAAPTAWLATARDVSRMTLDLHRRRHLFADDGGAIVRFVVGQGRGLGRRGAPQRHAAPPGAELHAGQRRRTERRTGDALCLRPAERADRGARQGATARTRAQYRLAGGATGWSDMRAMYIVPGVEDAPATLVWLSKDGVHQAILEAVPDEPAGGLAVGRARAPSAGAASAGAVHDALTGRRRDPAARREPDPADRRSSRSAIVVACFVGVRLGARAPGERRRRGARALRSPTWGVVPADLTAAWDRGDVRRPARR